MKSLIAGFLLHLAQIIAIGPQNIFILTNGDTGHKRLKIMTICILLDIMLIYMAIFGFIDPLINNQYTAAVLRFGGAAFLLKYAFSCFVKAIKNNEHLTKNKKSSNQYIILNAIFVSLLTPYVIIDTIAIAALSNEYIKIPFFLGNAISAITWFAGLGFASGRFYHILNQNQTWRYINAFTGSVMIFMGLKLLFA